MMFKKLAFLLLLLCADIALATDNPVEQYRWDNRILIVVADPADTQLASQISSAFKEAECELLDRDILIGWIYPGGDGLLADEVLSRESVQLLRDHLSLPLSPTIYMVLVGKDGGVKSRYEQLPSLDEVFALIDGMPMRRSEMKSSSRCQ